MMVSWCCCRFELGGSKLGFIGVCHIDGVGLIGVCYIEGVGLIGVCHIDGVGLTHITVWGLIGVI
jgi:hypothetical protein